MDRGVVNVSIQGESIRPVTLTGIQFHVQREPRPPGALFVDPCGGPTTGRAIVFSVDQGPPEILESNVLPNVYLGSAAYGGTPDAEGETKPIRFPWTVSLTDPLLLKLIAITKSSCYCSWTAEIPWVSGSKQGIIQVDNEGEGYRLTGSRGAQHSYYPGPTGRWAPWSVAQ